MKITCTTLRRRHRSRRRQRARRIVADWIRAFIDRLGPNAAFSLHETKILLRQAYALTRYK